ncbi:hypothetical protein COB55_01990 [Candidatus Wolfebacteria bacterium]|nr:MAG: hypothetical protein COB55_01990 [Candidatus Wolfebacteria bacterium]
MAPFTLAGITGLLIISYALWVNDERKQNILFALGGFALLAYSVHIGDQIFITLQAIFIISALAEFWKKS